MAMTAHWTRPGRGGAPVGLMQELSLLELGVIQLLRHWCDSETGRIRIAEDFAAVMDAEKTAAAVNHLGHPVTLLTQHGRRPMMRHDLRCGCFGGDEAVFAHMVAAATTGDTEDAMAFGLTLLTPDIAWEAVQAAAPLGRAILTLSRLTHPMPTRH